MAFGLLLQTLPLELPSDPWLATPVVTDTFTFAGVTPRDLLTVQDDLRTLLRGAGSLEAAAQTTAERLSTCFNANAVLVRLFITLPFGELPDDMRRRAWSVVEAQSLQGATSATTPVLTLLGTHGREPAWCDRRQSQGHAALPLSSRSFVDSIPMIARMLHEMGIDLGLNAPNDGYADKLLGGGWVGRFIVDDARSARDGLGRRIIPSIDFVESQGVRTVFGLAKAYATGPIATAIIFSNARVPREQVDAFIPILNTFRAATLDLVKDGRIFA